MDDEPVKIVWVRIRGKTKLGDAVVTVCHRPLDQEEVYKIFLRQLEEFSFSQTLVKWETLTNSVSAEQQHRQVQAIQEVTGVH